MKEKNSVIQAPVQGNKHYQQNITPRQPMQQQSYYYGTPQR